MIVTQKNDCTIFFTYLLFYKQEFAQRLFDAVAISALNLVSVTDIYNQEQRKAKNSIYKCNFFATKL